jgi:hypothetical protein
MRTVSALDQMVSYLEYAQQHNLGFKDVCAGMKRFEKIANAQRSLEEARVESRKGMLTLSELQKDSAAKISQFLLTGSLEDKEQAEYASRIEIIAPIMHENFIERLQANDTSPFARSQCSTQSAIDQSSEARRIENAQMNRERQEWATHLQNLRNTNVQLATSMAQAAMSHVKSPIRLISLDFKPIQEWLKAYHEYVTLGGTRMMNQFIGKAQLVVLLMAAGKDLTKVGTKEAFSNREIETLLKNHNVAKSLDQSVKRLKEKVVFSIKGSMPTLQEFSNYYEEFDDAVKSLGDTFMPAKKVVKEIFIAKIIPQNFQDVVKNECSSDPLHFQNYNTVFVKA